MKQRAVIAMALALHPSLVIADEPVTALDVIVQEQVLEVMRDLQERLGVSVMMITHDMSVVAQTCQDVVVMYAGHVVESGPVNTVFRRPAHPYTMGLTRAFPNLLEPRSLIAIEGHLPSLLNPPQGCRFAPRCPFAIEMCRAERAPYRSLESGHEVACHRMHEAEALGALAQDAETWQKMSV
jgi:peptide/nickel transport system ATP-binding protein